jgi:heptaprenyl diphosphate synthase
VTTTKRCQLDAALDWIHDYLTDPHPELGRRGAVCPYVKPAMAAETLRIEVWTDITVHDLESVVDRMVEVFRSTPWPEQNETLRALVVVLPGLDGDEAMALDDVHAAAKVRLAWEGLMLGQFHPRCQEPAARNQDFPVSQSPVPMLALRNMSFHDILFVNDEPDRFQAYRDRYGWQHQRGTVKDSLFSRLYHMALARLGG